LDGLNPESGTPGTIFEYRIRYSDADNDPPAVGYPQLHIEKPCGTPLAASPFQMIFVYWVGPVGDYTAGAIYSFSMTFSVEGLDYAYYFSASDGLEFATGAPTIPCTDGPDVYNPNNPPILDWTGEPGYTSDGVDPDTGDTSTWFEYRVKYSDADNDAPLYVELHIERPAGTPWSHSPFPMNLAKWIGAVGDYVTGAIYNYTTQLNFPGFDYCYYFEASDGIDPSALMPCVNGPDVIPVGPPAPPPNLWLERSGIDIILHWDTVVGVLEYRIYEAVDRFTLWPWPLLDTSLTNQYTAVGHGTDGSKHFYIVRAFNSYESTNSTMGAKAHLSFIKPIDPNKTDINWLSLPYDCLYKKASDVANELNSTKIRMIGKWDPKKQRAIAYSYVKGKWKGPDFDINPGEGIFIAGIQLDFDWVVVGTDSEITLNFTFFSKHKKNINWISLPYTGVYNDATSIIVDIEGSLFTPPTRIVEVGKWNPVNQSSEKFYWDGSQWIGMNFNIEPGEGVYLEIIKSFDWTIELVTPTVP